MARLRIAVEQLGAQGFRLELPGPGDTTNIIALAPGGGILGRYEQNERTIGLRNIRAETLELSELVWELAGGRVSGAASMREVEIDAEIAVGSARGERPAFVGSIRAETLDATVDLRLAGVVLNGARVRAEGVRLVVDEAGRADVRVRSASASTIRGEVRGLKVHAEDVALPDLLTLHQGTLRAEALSIGELRIEMPSVATGEAAASDAAPSEAPPRNGLPRLAFLDLLEGHFGVDVTTDFTLPIIGRRQATHRFRIPIAAGSVEINALGKGLSTLESLVLDFAMREDALVLVKDIPLVPFDSQVLVRWALDAEGLGLARANRVRLSTLLRPELLAPNRDATRQPTRESGKGAQLRRIDAEAVDLALGISAPFSLDIAGGRLDFGSGDRPSVGELRVQGNLGHFPEEPPRGRLVASAQEINATVSGVQLGRRRLEIGSLRLEALGELALFLAGLRPRALTSRATGLSLSKLELRGEAPQQIGSPRNLRRDPATPSG